jgi:hypothetical protein
VVSVAYESEKIVNETRTEPAVILSTRMNELEVAKNDARSALKSRTKSAYVSSPSEPTANHRRPDKSACKPNANGYIGCCMTRR